MLIARGTPYITRLIKSRYRSISAIGERGKEKSMRKLYAMHAVNG